MGRRYAFKCDWCGAESSLRGGPELPTNWVAIRNNHSQTMNGFGVLANGYGELVSEEYRFSCSKNCTHELMLKYAERPTFK